MLKCNYYLCFVCENIFVLCLTQFRKILSGFSYSKLTLENAVVEYYIDFIINLYVLMCLSIF